MGRPHVNEKLRPGLLSERYIDGVDGSQPGKACMSPHEIDRENARELAAAGRALERNPGDLKSYMTLVNILNGSHPLLQAEARRIADSLHERHLDMFAAKADAVAR